MDEKRKEILKDKLEEATSKLRKAAVQLDNAIEHSKSAKAMAIEALRKAEKQKNRKFATPANADEAEGEFPTMQVLLGGKTEREIIDSGTLLQKIKLYFIYKDFDGYYGTSQNLMGEVSANIAASIKSKKDDDLGRQCTREFIAFKKYGERLSFYFQMFQTSFAILARLLNRWDDYEKEAERITATFSRWLKRDPEVAEWFIKINLEHSLLNQWEGASLCFDREKGAFYVDVEKAPDGQKESLYSQIRNEAASATESLCDFKAFAMVAEDYIAKSKLKYMPISIQTSIENAELEKYTRYLVKNLSFFRSQLNFSKSNGKTITPDEERRAVIPDYYEVEPTKEMYDNCKMGMEQYLRK